MSLAILDPCLVVALLLNFYILAVERLRLLIIAVATQGVLLGALYPLAHQGDLPQANPVEVTDSASTVRLLALALVIIGIKGWLIPAFLFKAARLADVRSTVTSVMGFVPSMLLGALATLLALLFARSLPVSHESHLLIPASLATVLSGFIMLSTRREALAQVLGYIVLENGIFIFGLLLFEAVPLLVEFGVVLDLFVGVFVMSIIINHVSRAVPAASTEHLKSLKE